MLALKTKIKLRLRYAGAVIVSRLPFNFLRICIYRLFFHYKISFKARIKYGVVISVDNAKIGKKSRIGYFCKFEGPYNLEIGTGTNIGYRNTFLCGEWVLEDKFRNDESYKRSFKLGDNCRLGKHHYYDCIGGITIGNDTWIGGLHTQFWTHGAAVKDKSISIGNNCYIASGVKFVPGSSIGNTCIVSAGSIVAKRFEADNLMIGSATARVIQTDYDWTKNKSDL